MKIDYRKPVPADGPKLAAMARLCFTETFGPMYAPADLAAHLERMFGPGGLPAEIEDPMVRIMMAADGDAVAAYVKLAAMTLPVDHPAGSLEIKQFYVLGPWQGAGIAPKLMDWAVSEARGAGAPAIFLSVWSENARAIAFYRRHGFEIVGEAPFTVGARTDIDPVMGLFL